MERQVYSIEERSYKLEKEKIVLNAVLKTTELELKNLQERQRPLLKWQEVNVKKVVKFH